MTNDHGIYYRPPSIELAEVKIDEKFQELWKFVYLMHQLLLGLGHNQRSKENDHKCLSFAKIDFSNLVKTHEALL